MVEDTLTIGEPVVASPRRPPPGWAGAALVVALVVELLALLGDLGTEALVVGHEVDLVVGYTHAGYASYKGAEHAHHLSLVWALVWTGVSVVVAAGWLALAVARHRPGRSRDGLRSATGSALAWWWAGAVVTTVVLSGLGALLDVIAHGDLFTSLAADSVALVADLASAAAACLSLALCRRVGGWRPARGPACLGEGPATG